MRATLMFLAVVSALLAACEPLPPAPQMARGPLKIEESAVGMDSIPYQYGELVAVTALPGHGYTATLWFVQPAKSIVGVDVNIALGALGQAITIPRR